MNLLKYFLSLTLILGPYAQAWDQSTSKVVQVDQASGVSSTPNYWKSGDAEVTLTGVAAYADAVSAKPVDCTGGSPAITVARSATAPMYDKKSWLITKPASNVQGQGIAFEFDVDNGIAAVEMMDLMFEYIVGSGTFAAGSDTTNSDLMVYLYDVTAGKLIEPYGGSKLYTSSTTLKGDYRGWFQSTLGSKKYRVCLHQATTSASAYTLKVDAGKVQKSKQVAGTIITKWQSYASTTSVASGTFPTNTKNFYYRQVGDSIEIRFKITFTGTGTWAAPTFSLPPGLNIDATKLVIDGTGAIGQATLVDGTAGYAGVVAKAAADNAFRVSPHRITTAAAGHPVSADAPLTQSIPFTWSSTDIIEGYLSVPIKGWSAGARMSDGYDGRVINARYTSSSTSAVPDSATVFDFGTMVFNNAMNVTTGASWRATAKTYGFYRVTANINYTAASSASRNDLTIRKNGGTYKTNFVTTASGVVATNSISEVVELNAGEYVDVTNFETVNGGSYTNNHSIVIEKLSGTPFMSPTALWETHYAGTAGDAIGTSNSLIKFTNKIEDTFGSYNPATGLWTAKGPATCSASWAVNTASVNLSTSQRMVARLFKDGSSYADGSLSFGNGVSTVKNSIGNSSSIKVITGTELKVMAASDVATTAGTSQAGNYFTVSCRQSGN